MGALPAQRDAEMKRNIFENDHEILPSKAKIALRRLCLFRITHSESFFFWGGGQPKYENMTPWHSSLLTSLLESLEAGTGSCLVWSLYRCV